MDPPTDLRDGAADRVGSDSPAADLAPLEAVAAPMDGDSLPRSGQRWRHYRLADQIPGGPGRCFHGIDTDEHVGVVVRVTKIGPETEARRATWALLKDLHQPWMADLAEAQEDDGLRYEVSRLPPPLTLRDWVAQREPALPDFMALARQLASIVEALHACGVVHLNLRPDTLHLASTEGELLVQLGGLELATLFEQPQPFAVAVDPLYAPPEAMGLEMQPPGRALCSWDWWSMGRVMQEFVLGHHIFGDLLQRDVLKNEPGLRAEAEILLNETGDYRVRGGAVELMPAMYDSQMSLLRGLLASSRAGRWGYREVQLWLDHRPAKDRYDNPRDERFFIRPDGVYTVPEIAELFAQEANWKEGESNLFDTDDPASFVHFLAADAGNFDLYSRLKGLLNLGEIPEWRGLPDSAKRSVLAGIVWSAFTGPKMRLHVRGRRVTRHELFAFVREGGDGPALGRALLAAPYLHELQQIDAETATALTEVAGRHAAVLAEGVKHGWVTAGDPVASSLLLALSLDSPHALAEAARRLRATFACTRDPAAKALMAAASKEQNAQILLAYAEHCPERFGFVTQETLDIELYNSLKLESQRAVAALFWMRLRKVLESNPLVFGSLIALAGSWLCLAGFVWLTGLHLEARGWMVLFVVVPFVLRLVHWGGLGRVMGVYAPDARPWIGNDGIGRCRKEVAAAMPAAGGVTAEKISLHLAELNWRISEIPLKEAPRLLSPPGRFPALWMTSGACWLIMVLLFCSAAATGVRRVRTHNWRQGIQDGSGAGDSPRPDADWSFGDPRRLRIAWDIPRPVTVPTAAVGKILVATPDEVASALVEGERELLSYRRATVKPLIAVRVPTEAGVGFILFDSRDGTVAERRIYFVDRLPPARSWLTLGGHEAAYLGPSRPDVDSRRPEQVDLLQGLP